MSLEPEIERWPDDYLTTVRRLNSRWDLGLPDSPAFDRTIILDDKVRSLQRDCAKCIKYLTGEPEYRLDRLLEDFEQFAGTTSSQWIPKPSQERGTLPV